MRAQRLRVGGLTAARPEGFRLAACGAARPSHTGAGARRPLVQRRARHQKGADDDQGHHQHIGPHTADEGAQQGPLQLAEEAPVGAHVVVAEEGVDAFAGEDAEGVGGGGQRHSGDDCGDAPGQPAPPTPFFLGDQQVRHEGEEERQGERQDADEPARAVLEPAAERPPIPAQVEHEAEEDGQRETSDGAQLAAPA